MLAVSIILKQEYPGKIIPDTVMEGETSVCFHCLLTPEIVI